MSTTAGMHANVGGMLRRLESGDKVGGCGLSNGDAGGLGRCERISRGSCAAFSAPLCPILGPEATVEPHFIAFFILLSHSSLTPW